MRQKLLLFIFLLSSIISAQSNEEFRATWVVTWDHLAGNNAAQRQATARKILDDHKDANMNAVFWQARQSGTAYYDSDIEPWGYYVNYTDPGYDPLGYAVEEAHKRGMEIHAWFNVFHVSTSHAGTIPVNHPEWICTNQDGDYMTSYKCASPGLESVREYTVNLAMEIVRKYDIDGFHLDFVRWNEYDEDDMKKGADEVDQLSLLDGQFINEKIKSGEPTEGTKRYFFDAEHPASGGVPDGFSTWEEWRRWGVTEFVKTLHDSIQAVKPWVKLSAAALGKYKDGGVNGWNGYYVVFQDAALWFNEGYLDQLTPMHYHWTSGSGFVNNLNNDWKPNIQEGIAAKRLYTVGPGSYILDENNVWNNHPDIVNSVRNVDWTDGFQFFSYSSWENYDYWTTAGATFFNNKTKIRNMVEMPVSGTPELAINKIDSLNYDLSVTLPDSVSQNYWVVIYRSEDDVLNTDNDQIIYTGFTNSTAEYREDFHDAVNFEGKYTYFATYFNRYWNESGVSNSVMSDDVSFMEPTPEAPDFAGAFSNGTSSITVKCYEAEYAQGYAVAYSTDGTAYNDTAFSETTEITITDLDADQHYFLKIMAYNDRGFSASVDQLFAAGTGSDPYSVLVVNGFDRSTNTRLDYIKEYALPISDAGYGFSYVLNEMVYNGDVNLTDYDIVVWILGDESTADDTFNPSEQAAVKTFLNGGGSLFVSGAEIGWDLEGKADHPTANDIAFYNDYLKAHYVADAPGNASGAYYTLEGTSTGFYNNMSGVAFDDGSHGTYDVDWPDAISPSEGAYATMLFSGAPSGQDIAGISYYGPFPEGTETGALLYFTVPFETIYNLSDRIAIMKTSLDYLSHKLVGVEEENSGIPSDYGLSQNYPNPFNPVTKISFELPESGMVKLVVYNMLGEQIATLINGNLNAGIHFADFNASQFTSGVYVYRLEAGGKVFSKKMMLLK